MPKFNKFQVQKNKILIFLFVNLLLTIALGAFFIFSSLNSTHEIVYVDTNLLFEEFRMTREMRQIGEKEFNHKKTLLDSLYLEVQREDLSKELREKMMKEFVSKRDQFDQFNEQFAIEESKKIWTRISSYSEQFAQDNNYKVILGSNTTQNVLYGNKTLDVTKELLEYINKKYSGL